MVVLHGEINYIPPDEGEEKPIRHYASWEDPNSEPPTLLPDINWRVSSQYPAPKILHVLAVGDERCSSLGGIFDLPQHTLHSTTQVRVRTWYAEGAKLPDYTKLLLELNPDEYHMLYIEFLHHDLTYQTEKGHLRVHEGVTSEDLQNLAFDYLNTVNELLARHYHLAVVFHVPAYIDFRKYNNAKTPKQCLTELDNSIIYARLVERFRLAFAAIAPGVHYVHGAWQWGQIQKARKIHSELHIAENTRIVDFVRSDFPDLHFPFSKWTEKCTLKYTQDAVDHLIRNMPYMYSRCRRQRAEVEAKGYDLFTRPPHIRDPKVVVDLPKRSRGNRRYIRSAWRPGHFTNAKQDNLCVMDVGPQFRRFNFMGNYKGKVRTVPQLADLPNPLEMKPRRENPAKRRILSKHPMDLTDRDLSKLLERPPNVKVMEEGRHYHNMAHRGTLPLMAVECPGHIDPKSTRTLKIPLKFLGRLEGYKNLVDRPAPVAKHVRPEGRGLKRRVQLME